MSSWVVIETHYSCEARVVQIDCPSLIIVGDHLSGMNDTTVESLMVLSQELPQIPDGIESFFPNLRGIQIYDSKLQTISKDVLKFPNLQVLFLNNNELVTLDADLFAYTPKLVHIWFRFNSLQHVGFNIFGHLNELATALFYGNPCTNQDANSRPEVIELNIQLPISCQPLDDNSTTTISTTTTEPSEHCDECEWRTVEIVTKLVDEQEARIVEHKNDLTELVGAYEMRISELEAQMREILANPCAC